MSPPFMDNQSQNLLHQNQIIDKKWILRIALAFFWYHQLCEPDKLNGYQRESLYFVIFILWGRVSILLCKSQTNLQSFIQLVTDWNES